MKNSELFSFYKNLDRSLFIENENKQYARYDEALPIGYNQTISQPSLVYEMSSVLKMDKNCKVLEIGTGSGYQTAFLAEFSGEVYTVERIRELSIVAEERLARLGYKNIKFKIGDGSTGWIEFAPFDRIIATAAAAVVPEPLIDQLSKGGRMIIPVGKKGLQDLLLIEKDMAGNVSRKFLGEVAFVEFKGDYGWTH